MLERPKILPEATLASASLDKLLLFGGVDFRRANYLRLDLLLGFMDFL